MNDNKFVKFFTLIGFLVFAAISCWATEESLHLLLPSWPSVFCWAITVGFFVIASLGTKMIADSLNKDVYSEHKGAMLLGGIVLVFVFWLFCSMPTNTHTFFFRNLIDEKVNNDISETKEYLIQIRDNVVTESTIEKACAEVENKVEAKLRSLEMEIKNPLNPGNGPATEKVLGEIADILGIVKISKLSGSGNSESERKKLYEAYREIVLNQLENKKVQIRKSLSPSSNTYKKTASADIRNLDIIAEAIKSGDLDLTDAENVQEVCSRLNKSYSTIKAYKEHVNFSDEQAEENYTCEHPQTKVSRLLSVYDVWVDFLTGKEGGLAFIFWILISVLVDIAAFIFFDIAFKKSDY